MNVCMSCIFVDTAIDDSIGCIRTKGKCPMNKKIRISGFLILLILYIVFFGFIIDREAVYVPVWAVDRTNSPPAGGGARELVPFETDGFFGYLDMSGSVHFQEHTLYDVALSETGYINYSRLSDSLVLKNTEGDIRDSLDIIGYPMYAENRLLVFSPDRLRLSEYDTAGECVWTYSFNALITAIDVSREFILAGLVNGTLVLLSNQGEELYSVKPGGSRVEIIYGCAFTRDAGRLAVISGLDPQKLLFIEMKNDVYRIEEMHTFEEPSRSSVYMEFSPDGTRLLISLASGTFLYYPEEGSLKTLSAGSTMTGADIHEAGKLSEFLFTRNGGAVLTVMDIGGNFREDIPIPGGSGYMSVTGNSTVFSVDPYFLKADLEVR